MPPNGSTHNDLHALLLERFGARGEALYMGVLGFVAITVNGLAAYLLKYPLLFPSLAPTVFHTFRSPLDEDATPRNTITGHFVGLLAGLLSLAAGIVLLTTTCWALNRLLGVPVPPWGPRRGAER